MKKVDINIFEQNWIKLPPAKLERLKKLREKFEKLNL